MEPPQELLDHAMQWWLEAQQDQFVFPAEPTLCDYLRCRCPEPLMLLYTLVWLVSTDQGEEETERFFLSA